MNAQLTPIDISRDRSANGSRVASLTALPTVRPGARRGPRRRAAFTFDIQRIHDAVNGALTAVENAKQKCLAAGQMLNEIKESLPHGEFKLWRQKHLPQISDDTAERWARAAQNIARALPPPRALDVQASVALTTPDDDLSETARKYKQDWSDFTANKTIKECLNAVFVEGDPAHRVDRVLNGKLKGGTNPYDDRKDYPLFIAVKLKDMAGHLSHWPNMTDLQRSEIEQIFRAAIIGDTTTLSRKLSRTFKFQIWPEQLSRIATDALRQRLKG
jgi:hypothetical protein